MKYDILIATPLRLVTLIRSNAIDLSSVEMIIMDEADKLLEFDRGKAEMDEEEEENEEGGEVSEQQKRDRSSFLSQIDEILSQCPSSSSSSSSSLQRGLFSATIGPFVKELASAFLVDPVEVSIGVENSGASTIQQKLIFVGREDGKLLAIRQLIQKGIKPPVLLFVQSIDR
jgi:ATP-dependent RNA helicase DDX52/ROK1